MDKKSSVKAGPTAQEELDEFQTMMGSLAQNYTVTELQQLKDEMQLMADLLLDFYLIKRKCHRTTPMLDKRL